MSSRKNRSLIIPIFIPYQGCPQRCVFCEQEKITSRHSQPIRQTDVQQIIDQAIRADGFDPSRNPEIAFYGGTFTRLPFGQMTELLDMAFSYIERGLFHSIRVSTRPDSLDDMRLAAMKERGVLTVELGVQSMDNHVLFLSKRGHAAEDTVTAVARLRRAGFRVGIQLMPGLPGDSREVFYSTITKVIDLRPDMVRLYPAIVIRGTELARMVNQGEFTPLSLNQAVDICAEACIRLEREGIPVIRMGLMSSPTLLQDGQIVGGPWHPAFGFLARSAIYHRNIEALLPDYGENAEIRLTAAKRDIPLLRGYQNQGLEMIRNKTGATKISVQMDESLPRENIKVTFI